MDQIERYMKERERVLNPVPSDNDYLLARLDGVKFSRYTQALNKPYDEEFGKAMISTATKLLRHYDALLAYTQSDEITLIFDGPFSNKPVQKLVSVMASLAGGFFNRIFEHPNGTIATFDCRVFSLSSKKDVIENINWRIATIVRNSVNNIGRYYLGHRNNVKLKEMKARLDEAGIDWAKFDDHYYYGSIVRLVSYSKEARNLKTGRKVTVNRRKPEVTPCTIDVRKSLEDYILPDS